MLVGTALNLGLAVGAVYGVYRALLWPVRKLGSGARRLVGRSPAGA